ncbi:hypothetical protein AZF37_08050 [endosymbiont 'TC1' of Trimyema compressum]|uniref:Crp/Fnr family transcriptional regulator n=1 Tax=endosymbiont 'TC1' of Trimyema compressum TaxID=243899 RepID=UPI0007F07FDD|nr:helix-turn-helix domain-containing protein [endosymbiont 'TC1' of Trimyema compressum]AMP21115.1 hypothetical protein AZF37_08050 [endosymbiont 'TC1' of Trimyema compressum]
MENLLGIVGTNDTFQRTASYLHLIAINNNNLTDKNKQKVKLPLTKKETAKLLSMSQETLSRQLKRLHEMAVIKMKNSTITIVDEGQLERIAGK